MLNVLINNGDHESKSTMHGRQSNDWIKWEDKKVELNSLSKRNVFRL